MTALRREFDDSSPRAPGAPDGTSTQATSKNEDGFDLGALLADRRHEAFALHERYLNPQMPRVLRTLGFDREWVRAEGPYLFDRDGTAYLDFLAGFGVFALGRCHPVIEQSLQDAMEADLPNLVQMDCPPLAGLLAEALVARMPDAAYRCFFTNSGAESIETVLKFARGATGRTRILFADHAFHGLTTGALSLNGGREFRDGFGDLLPGCQGIAFGDLDALRRELEAGDVAAFVVEPIQGKGVFVAPEDYLREAADLCHRHGALLAVDEVQTGLGRTGTFFAFEQWGVVPDIVTVAKALSGGYVPVGAVIARAHVV
jgi:ornithine--oxo-acid transaminase